MERAYSDIGNKIILIIVTACVGVAGFGSATLYENLSSRVVKTEAQAYATHTIAKRNEQRIGECERRTARIESGLPEKEKRITAAEVRLTSFQEKIKELRGWVRSIEQRIK